MNVISMILTITSELIIPFDHFFRVNWQGEDGTAEINNRLVQRICQAPSYSACTDIRYYSITRERPAE